ncbi:non-ribosomal peptide synthetase [Micromonospora coxensis]|uniref:Amino acid adenylation domain-containing protein n=1 Tax=Micromonospora coxensis TaxID=356852 RepID=A0A1C5JZK2_9ACTN|nr:non-ribosomal peptide synthetase [Micromonospora coxensis]SCG75985.1 amino acid adenylation domain-containing protein [Micromonospora coxensis]
MIDLSPQQERMWFLQRLDPGDASYNIYWVHRLRGPLDADALARALAATVTRHEVLRTRYLDHDGVPVGDVTAPAPVEVEHVEIDEADAEQAAHRLVLDRVREPFDLAAGPPLRVTLLRLGEAEHILCLVVHHIAADGLSMRIVGDEIAAAYQAFVEGATPPARPAEPAHRDYVAALRGDTGRHSIEQARKFWAEELAGVADLQLPVDLPRAAVRTTTGGLHRLELPAELLTQVDTFARRHRCTTFMILLAAYEVLLARHANQDDFCVGVPVAGRDQIEFERVIGCLATTIAIRADLAGTPSFHTLVERVRARCLSAFSHQQLPFAEVMAELDVSRDRSRTPVYQAMFSLQYEQPQPFSLGAADGATYHIDHAQAKCDLAMEIWRGPAGARLDVSYSAGLFTADTAQRLAQRFVTLLRRLLSAPDAPVGAVDMLSPAESRLLSERGDGGTLTSTAGATVLDRFLDRARRSPQAPAVCFDGGEWSYGELAEHSHRVASRLRAAGVRPGGVVGVFLPRGPMLIAALLGVWRAGAAYVPLDPRYTTGRTAQALRDSGAACVLVDARSAAQLPAESDTPAVRVDEAGTEPTATPPAPQGGHTAYVIYTSGSTGRPKGVAVSHACLTAFLDATAARVGGTGPDAAWLALTSVSFDISGLEMYLPLATGGRVAVCGEEIATGDGAAVVGFARRQRVTHVQATPSGWQVLLAGAPHLPEVTALVGGEALPLPLARQLRGATARLFNMYGPTETTIWSACWEVPAEPAHVSLGEPIPGTRLRVLDPSGGLCPIGVPGELVIGGAGVALGYLHRPGLTGQRFVPDPWGPPGSRMYRTGDLVRYRADGGLEFLGRGDQQVKVRGHRLELGEVEGALRAAPGVREAAAALHGDRLLGYVTGDVDPEQVRARLATVLPGYAVPSVVLVLPALPLTPNGKLDRSALPTEPATPAATPAPEYVGAAAQMHDIWCEVLGRTSIGPDDDIFDLGGHSLTMARIAARVRERMEVDLPLSAFFDAPTIRGLSQFVQGTR